MSPLLSKAVIENSEKDPKLAANYRPLFLLCGRVIIRYFPQYLTHVSGSDPKSVWSDVIAKSFHYDLWCELRRTVLS